MAKKIRLFDERDASRAMRSKVAPMTALQASHQKWKSIADALDLIDDVAVSQCGMCLKYHDDPDQRMWKFRHTEQPECALVANKICLTCLSGRRKSTCKDTTSEIGRALDAAERLCDVLAELGKIEEGNEQSHQVD